MLAGAAIMLFGMPVCISFTTLFAGGASSPTAVFLVFLLSAIFLPVLVGGYVAGLLSPGSEKANAAAAAAAAMTPGLVGFALNLERNIERYEKFLGGSRGELAGGIALAIALLIVVAMAGARIREWWAKRRQSAQNGAKIA